MGSGHDDGVGKVWLAQFICRLVYSVYQDNGNYYNNGSAPTAATTAAAVAATEMVMSTTTVENRILVTEARVDQLDCGGTWTLDCRRAASAWPDGELACTDSRSAGTAVVVRMYLPTQLSAHFQGQPAVSVGLPERARGNATVTVVRCDGGGDGNQVACSIQGDLWPAAERHSSVNVTSTDDNLSAITNDTNATDHAVVSSNATADGAQPEDNRRWYNWKYLFVVVFIASGGVGNILVCLAICLDRQLQNVTNYFLLSLAIADLLVCLFVMPLGAIPGFYGKYHGQRHCTIIVL